MGGRHVPGRVFSIDSEAVYLSVREAALLLDVSTRSVYGYLAQGKLTRVEIEGMILLEEEEVLAFERRAPGRRRQMPPLWHCAPEHNPLLHTIILVSLRPGCDALLQEKLAEFRRLDKHIITGATARSISRTPGSPGRLIILLFWRGESLPPAEQCEQELAALGADLAQVCDWETALILEGQAGLHTS